MHKFSFIVLFAFAAFLNMSCSSTESQLKNSASDYAEVPMPESALSEEYPEPEIHAKYPGGSAALNEHIRLNTVIPEIARIEGYEGRLLLTYVVDEKGKAGQVEIINSPHESISEMYKSIVDSMERWEPAVLRGEPVEQRYVITSFFRDGNS